MFNRLLHEELTKTNYQIIYSEIYNNCDLELVTSWRQEVRLTGLDLLTWHGWRGGNTCEPDIYVARQGNNKSDARETRLWTTGMGPDRDELRWRKVSPPLWWERAERCLDYSGTTWDKTRLIGTRGQGTS